MNRSLILLLISALMSQSSCTTVQKYIDAPSSHDNPIPPEENSNENDSDVDVFEFTWSHPTSLVNDNVSAENHNTSTPEIAMDDNGNAVMVWTQHDGTTSRIYKADYRNGQWTFPDINQPINPLGIGGAGAPKVAMDNNGNAIIVWYQFGGTYLSVYKMEYRNGNWDPNPALGDFISITARDCFNPRVAMDDDGNAIIVWWQTDGINYRAHRMEYRNGNWSSPTIFSPAGQDAMEVYVAMDDNGNAVTTWGQSDGSNLRSYRMEYRNGAWMSATIHSPASADAYPLDVAMDNNGNAIIVGILINNSNNYQVFKSEYRDGAWVDPATNTDYISTSPNQDASGVRLAMDNQNNAIIVWAQNFGGRERIFKKEYRTGWSPAVAVSPSSTNAYDPFVSMNDEESAVIVWIQSDHTSTQTFKAQYHEGNWTYPDDEYDNISPDGQAVSTLDSAMNSSGNIIIAWTQYDGTSHQIYKSEYR